jgi:hypothetical protein
MKDSVSYTKKGRYNTQREADDKEEACDIPFQGNVFPSHVRNPWCCRLEGLGRSGKTRRRLSPHWGAGCWGVLSASTATADAMAERHPPIVIDIAG